MKQPPPRRPVPRTLVSSPPPSLRAPRASLYQARFPALATVLAGGVVLPACHDPVCGATRADELEAHGHRVASAAHVGRAGDAVREIGVALGVVPHASTSAPALPSGGAVASVTTLPTPPQMPTGGAPVAVDTTPPQAPVQPAQRVTPVTPGPNVLRPGARMPVTQHPGRIPPPPHVAPVPRPESDVDGGMMKVSVLPAPPAPRRA